MLLASQNLTRYMQMDDSTVLRINLAWVEDLSALDSLISRYPNDIFIDLPIGRTKPPNNTYDVKDLNKIIKSHKNVKYIAISNVESPSSINKYYNVFGKDICLVPKIESKKGIDNIDKICSVLRDKRIIMLDHDDLFSDLVAKSISPSSFMNYIETLENFCLKNGVDLLKTRGVLFSDSDKYNF